MYTTIVYSFIAFIELTSNKITTLLVKVCIISIFLYIFMEFMLHKIFDQSIVNLILGAPE